MKKGSKASKEFKEKRSNIMKEKWKNKDFRKLMSQRHKGKIPWNKGLTKNTDKRLKISGIKISKNKDRNIKLSKTRKKLFKEGKLINYFRGKKHTDETKKKIGQKSIKRGALKGKNNPWFNNGRFGELNPMWKGGKSFEPYTFKFNSKLKKLIRERDKYKCKICNNFGNIIHHINYDKKNCEPENLITLCRRCHSKTNVNRSFWEEYFNEKCI